MRFSLAVWLLIALIAATLVGGFSAYKAITAKADCRTQMARSAQIAVENERDRATKAERKAATLFDDVKGDVRSSLQTLKEANKKRSATIRATAVSGECRMPALPSLRDAVKEARDAAVD